MDFSQKLSASAELKQELSKNTAFLNSCEEASRTIIEALKKGQKILIAGNGGSAADAQHFAAELVVRFETERKALPAICLSSNTSSLTAGANDYGYEEVFARQVEAFGTQGDIFIGISTSGNSPNIIRAVNQAQQQGLNTIILNGRDGGTLSNEKVDVNIIVPHKETKRIQEVHITLIHTLCGRIDKAFKGR